MKDDHLHYTNEMGEEFELVPHEFHRGDPAGVGCDVSMSGTCGTSSCRKAKPCTPRRFEGHSYVPFLKGRHVWKRIKTSANADVIKEED